jgi:predicted transposase YbfD/YdcC
VVEAAEHVATSTGKPTLMMQIRLDGKTSRGATDAEGNQLHLLAALIGRPGKTTVIAAQTEVGAKTNEVVKAVDVLDQIDLTNTVSTADALHTVKATADYIHRRKGFFLLPVKENRAALYAACDVLPWASTPIAHQHTEHGHGRITRRTIRVLPAPDDLPFPHVKQVYLIERYVTDTTGQSPSAAAALGVTNLTDTLAGPAGLATYVQHHWVWNPCTGCVTPATAKTTAAPTPDPAPESSRPYVTWPSGHYAWPAATTSPKPPDGPTAT